MSPFLGSWAIEGKGGRGEGGKGGRGRVSEKGGKRKEGRKTLIKIIKTKSNGRIRLFFGCFVFAVVCNAV